MKAPEPTPESLEKARPAIDRWRSDYRKCPHWPKLKRRECEDCGAEVVALALDEAVRDTKERAAKLVDDKCAFILSRQLGGKDYKFEASVDQNLRMMAVLLPDLAAAIREV